MPANAAELHAAAWEAADASLAWAKARKAHKEASAHLYALLSQRPRPTRAELRVAMDASQAAHDAYVPQLTRLEAAVQAWAAIRPEAGA